MNGPDSGGKAWGGRFHGGTDKRVEAFSESISYDRRLFHHDIAGSIAHAKMLASVGVMTAEEATSIEKNLREIEIEIESGRFEYSISKEDIHMHIESALIARLGDTGRKLHTGRSRNDQVATDSKLWTRDALDRIDSLLAGWMQALVRSGRRHQNAVIPGYTHLQRAQPVLAGHYFLAYVEKCNRDRSRVADCRKRLNESPLGAAALAGTSLPINRQMTAQSLGFDRPAANSLDVSSDRDWAIESVFVLTMIQLHLSNWAEEWILWTTAEYGFLLLPDEYCTGSSIMPQKKNPDVLELTRGRAARVIGDLTTLLTLVKALPLAYNRDLQEDKEPLFDAFDTVEACLALAALITDGAKLREDRIRGRIDEGFLDATALMEALIKRKIPQRSAHELVGRLVGLCEKKGCRLADLSETDFKSIDTRLDGSLRDELGVDHAVAGYQSFGSSAPGEVERRLTHWESALGMKKS
jgi:argininosuccinate lyase